MLETRLETGMPPTSARARRTHTQAQPDTRPETRPDSARAAESARRALPSARSSRLSRSEMRLMGLATVSTAVVCALLLLYLAAYAHVTQLGIAQAQARVQLHRDQIRSGLLQAECSALESPQRIVAAAAAQGMTPCGTTPVDYVTVAQSRTKQSGVEIASDWKQGSKGGTTEDSRAAASWDH